MADMNKRGGDLDLYIETQQSDWGVLLPLKYRFVRELKKHLGDQKIDLVLRRLYEDPEDRAIFQEAHKTGVKLV